MVAKNKRLKQKGKSEGGKLGAKNERAERKLEGEFSTFSSFLKLFYCMFCCKEGNITKLSSPSSLC
jgi:hypothetical protein